MNDYKKGSKCFVSSKQSEKKMLFIIHGKKLNEIKVTNFFAIFANIVCFIIVNLFPGTH